MPASPRQTPALSTDAHRSEARDRRALSRPPLPFPLRLAHEVNLGDSLFLALTATHAGSLVTLPIVLAVALLVGAAPALERFGLPPFLAGAWAPEAGAYGLGFLILGSLITAALALALAAPFALGVAIFLAELAPPRLARPLGTLVELLAAVPAVVFGLWGASLVPAALATRAEDLIAAGTVLGVTILPTMAAGARTVLRSVPAPLRESALALGTTRTEAVRGVVLPYARSGLMGVALLGLGRAVGESVVVAMVVRSRPATLASVLLSPLAGTPALPRAVVATLAVVLLAVTLALNVAGRVLTARVAGRGSER